MEICVFFSWGLEQMEEEGALCITWICLLKVNQKEGG